MYSNGITCPSLCRTQQHLGSIFHNIEALDMICFNFSVARF